MSSKRSPNDAFDLSGVEAMLKGAGDYVGCSDDLRPRVIEEVRLRRTEAVRRRRLMFGGGGALLGVAMIGLQAVSVGESVSDATPTRRVAQLVAEGEASTKRAGVEAFCWSLVDAFLKVRDEQAEAFQPQRDGAATGNGEADRQSPSDPRFSAQAGVLGGSL